MPPDKKPAGDKPSTPPTPKKDPPGKDAVVKKYSHDEPPADAAKTYTLPKTKPVKESHDPK